MFRLKRLFYISILPIILLLSCNQKGFDGKAVQRSANEAEKSSERNSDSDVIQVMIDDRSIEQVLCQEGPKVIGLVSEVDFSSQFSLVCDAKNTNELFKELIQKAYQGQGTPTVVVAKSSTSSNYVTNLALAYAIKVPLENPSMFADLEAHAIFAEGVTNDNSELFIKVASRDSFPGRRSVEKVTLDYDLNNAYGAAIHDTRKTEFNTYILIEDNRDITVSIEHLIDVDNEYYHLANGLTIGIKAEDNQSYLVFVTELVIKNRIDPERMERTLISLNERVAEMLHAYISSKSM